MELDDEELEATRRLNGVEKSIRSKMEIQEAIEILNIASNKRKGLHVYQDTLSKAIEVVLKDREKGKARIQEAITWINNTMNDSHVIGCNLGDLQLLLDILED